MYQSTGGNIETPRMWQVAVLVGFLLGMTCIRDAQAVDLLDALKAKSLLNSSNLTLIDVRTLDERAVHGVPEGSIWIEWRGAQNEASFIRDLQTTQPDMSRPLAFICSVGHRSGLAARLAEKAGYRRVFDVAEGMNGSIPGPGWRLWGLPLGQ